MSKFKPVEQNINFVQMEKDLLEKWSKEGIYNKYLTKNDGAKKQFSFMDGPITANNFMGVHHAWGRTLKDIYQKFYNLKGYEQRFQNGFDNQGLWVEVSVEKEKGFKSKKDIETYGIDKFVEDCKKSTYDWSLVQKDQSVRLGYFMDWENSYYTMSEENNYTIWYFLKKCNEKGYIYKGLDILPWCPRCGTAISQHEILTDEYKEMEDEAVYFKLKIEGRENEYLLVWTTTPWTLVANVAVAVAETLEYSKVKIGDEIIYIASSRVDSVISEDYTVEGTVMGTDLIGLTYQPLYTSDIIPALADYQVPYKVVSGGMYVLVSDTEGTGMVHIAPGCGAEDHQLGESLGMPSISPLDEAGKYVDGYGFLTGKFAHDVNPDVFDFLQKIDRLYKNEKYKHRYPKCWRCSTKLIFRLADEWYISMKDLRYDMMAVAKQINWIPSFGLDRELEWLENMHDWCISKKRYWGLALPIWVCKDCGNFEVIGSQDELKERATEGWDKFEGHTPHRPYVDEVKIKCSKCGGVSERIKDVGNPWLDAGIVPFSTLNYLSDNKKWQKWYPTDFVCECFPGQFKNWFYSLIAMSTVLENKPPFKNLLGHEIVKDEHGEEMHKSKGNSIAFDDAANKAGADILRWAYVRQNPTNQMLFGFKLIEEYKKNYYLILWNIYKYFITYADLANFEPTKDDISKLKLTILDKWLLSRLNTLIKTTDENMSKYDHTVVTKALEDFILELSTWYIRRSRDRFADLDNVALNMMYYTLKRSIILLSMFMPFISDEMYQNIVKSVDTEAKDSVHLEDFPTFDEKMINPKMEEQMQIVKQLSSIGQSIRVSNSLKIRQPLAEIQIKGVKLEQEYIDILLNELNIKNCKIVDALTEGENWKVAEVNYINIAIDSKLTDELKAEGFLREFVRSIQNERKKSGLTVGESVQVIAKNFDENQQKLINETIEDIKSQVYAISLTFVADVDDKEYEVAELPDTIDKNKKYITVINNPSN